MNISNLNKVESRYGGISLFKKKDTKAVRQGTKAQAKKTAVKSGKVQTSKSTTKNGKTKTGKAVVNGGKAQAGKTPSQSGNTQDRSDVILAKLMAIEKETRLKEAKDRVDRLEDENIAENIEQLLKILGTGK